MPLTAFAELLVVFSAGRGRISRMTASVTERGGVLASRRAYVAAGRETFARRRAVIIRRCMHVRGPSRLRGGAIGLLHAVVTSLRAAVGALVAPAREEEGRRRR